jgi:pimeloyl-ACP methyl ester carboxylesterase
VEQEIRFCVAPDGVRLAWARHGSGPPIVKAANWLSHLEHDWRSPIWRHWLEGLSLGRTLVRYDERGCGLSDRDVEERSLEAWVADLEAVVDAAGLERFGLLGVSQGGPVAISYAVRHPERVSHLVLYGSFPRGWPLASSTARERFEPLIELARVGWGLKNSAFRRVFVSLFFPNATSEQMDAFDDLQRASASPQDAARLLEAFGSFDVTELLGEVTAPTLVLHARHDALVPFSQGRLLATQRNHLLLVDEPAWTEFLTDVQAFLGCAEALATA